MSHYTTGEIAKLAGVTVRTVQYYDNRGILIPSELTEGGRRLYTDDDVRKLRTICFLREIGLSIGTTGRLFQEEDPGSVIDLLLEQREGELRDEIGGLEGQLESVRFLRREIRGAERFSVESIGDMAKIMENKKKLRNLYIKMLAVALPVELLEIAGIYLWITHGNWYVFAAWAVIAVPFIWGFSKYYLKNVAYICPKCHETFKPSFREAFWARHTLRTRKLTCTCCGHKGFCVETWGGEK